MPFTVGIVLLVFLAGVASDCPGGWVTYGSKCYFVSHDTEDWPGALVLCERLGGQLAEINDATEGVFLSNLTHANKDHSKAGVWIGLTDIAEEGVYVWVQSKSQLGAGSYSNWGQGQPDNTHGNQNCVWLNGNDAGHWMDGTCHLAKHFMCEKDSGVTGEIVG